MTEKTIRRLKIENFKSIDSLEVKGLAPFSVFAGANGSGKSNFFDALDFVSLFVRGGVEIALRSHGGFANIHSAKREGTGSKKFGFEIECDLLEKQKEMPTAFHYSLSSDSLDSNPKIEEYLYVNGERSIERIRSKFVHYENGTESLLAGEFPSIYSVLPHFPAHLVSDGTRHALCLLVAVLDAPSGCGITLIEEPDRGLHPKAIYELIDLIRQQASPENPIWLTTHSESVVRVLNLSELVLVDKVDGRTRMKQADAGNISQEDLDPLSLDEVWLSNLFAGGLPW